MLFFLGNKAFVIDFLETGQFCCVYCYDRLGYKSLRKYISPTRISTGLYSNLSGVLLKFVWCVAVICQQIYTKDEISMAT